MSVMAKEPPKKNREKQGRSRETGKTRLLTVEIPAELDDAFERYRQDDRRTKRVAVEMALEAYLAEKGYWPPTQ